MNLNRRQKLVLAVTAALACLIWLLPHWRLRGHSYCESIEADDYDNVGTPVRRHCSWSASGLGYSWIFRNPPGSILLNTEETDENGYLVSFRVELDWPRQFIECGLLAVLAALVFSALSHRSFGQELLEIAIIPFRLLAWVLGWINRFGSTPETVLAHPEQFDLDRGTCPTEDTWFWCTRPGKVLWYSATIVIYGSILLGILYAFVRGVIL